MKRHSLRIFFVALFLFPHAFAVGNEKGVAVVVSTSMLASAAKEITVPSRPLEIVTMLPPGSCPGHFDLSPRIVPLLKSAALSIRHDFQDAIEQKLAAMNAGGISFVKIALPGSPLIPSNYYLLAEQTGAAYESIYPEIGEEIAAALDSVKKSTEEIAEMALTAASPWKGRSVIASFHVAELCRWLGFEVIGIIKRPEDTTPHDLQHLVRLKPDMIVANLQEGTQGAESLGKMMKLPVAVLSNFPGATGYGEDYYDLMRANLARLDEAWQKR